MILIINYINSMYIILLYSLWVSVGESVRVENRGSKSQRTVPEVMSE